MRAWVLLLLPLPAVECLGVPRDAPAYNEADARLSLLMSAAAYCAPDDLHAWTCAPCLLLNATADGVAVLHGPSDTQGLVASLTLPRGGAVTAVAFRGTLPEDIANVVLDLSLRPARLTGYPGCGDCEVHTGFYEAYTALAPALLAAVDAAGTASTAIHITGHSLGGALSQLAAYELAMAGYNVRSLVSFGSPRVGNAAFAAAVAALGSGAVAQPVAAVGRAHAALPPSAVLLRAVGRAHADAAAAPPPPPAVVWRVTHGRDVIPHLPPAWLGYAHAPREAFYCSGWQCPLVAPPPPHAPSRRLLRRGGLPSPPLQALPVPPAAGSVSESSAGSVERVVECSPTNGEDPRCADGLWLPLSLEDHLVYLGTHVSRMCARE